MTNISQVSEKVEKYFDENGILPEIRKHFDKAAELAQKYFSIMDESITLEWEPLKTLSEEGIIDCESWNFSDEIKNQLENSKLGQERELILSLCVDRFTRVDSDEFPQFINKYCAFENLLGIFLDDHEEIDIRPKIEGKDKFLFIISNS
ncbi:MAG: hypothetical protein CMO81_00985 [Waddliaceae bacterium]|nr:hypothetical protein [Waddliaceae bacterium]